MVNNLRFYRKSKNLTQTQLANKAGMSQSYIAAIENGKIENFSARAAFKLANSLDVSVEELFPELKEKVKV